MQHLDEGTIHSWLDGALSADEAARVEAHVAECPQCAAAVAEARGFIAASSRILTALDDVPRAVLPAATRVKWHNRAAWRAAAAVLVVAVGSLVVLRNGGNETADRHQYLMEDSASERATPRLAAPIIIQGNSSGGIAIDNSRPSAAPSEKLRAKAAAPDKLTATAQASAARSSRTAYSGAARGRAPQPNVQALANKAGTAQANGGVAESRSTSSGYAGAAVVTPQSSVRTGVTAVTMDAARGQMPLKVVGTPRMLGAKVTLYEVAPGDTVTFTEPMNIQLNAVVVTGVATAAPMARRSAGKSATTAQRNDAAASSAADSQSLAKEVGAPTVPQSAVTPPSQVEVANGVTTISWLDPSTGNTLKLSGRMPKARLEEVRIRIERERAAAAKKSP